MWDCEAEQSLSFLSRCMTLSTGISQDIDVEFQFLPLMVDKQLKHNSRRGRWRTLIPKLVTLSRARVYLT